MSDHDHDHDHPHNAPPNPYHNSARSEEHNKELTERVG